MEWFYFSQILQIELIPQIYLPDQLNLRNLRETKL